MEMIEWIIYFSLAIIVTALVILAFTRMTSIRANDIQFENTPEKYLQVTNETVTSEFFNLWDRCGKGKVGENLTFQYISEFSMNEDEIFDEIMSLNLCSTFASASRDCGTREDFSMLADLEPSRVYIARCDPATKQLIVE